MSLGFVTSDLNCGFVTRGRPVWKWVLPQLQERNFRDTSRRILSNSGKIYQSTLEKAAPLNEAFLRTQRVDHVHRCITPMSHPQLGVQLCLAEEEV